MKVLFDTPHIYYLPQYLPVKEVLARRGVECGFLAYDDPDVPGLLPQALNALDLDQHYVKSEQESLALYRELRPDWVVFGNGFTGLHQLDPVTRTAMINHGAGIKSGGFNPAINHMDVRFLEGPYHYRELTRAFPDSVYQVSGFAKLDPLLKPHAPMIDLAALGLDPSKPTILYAPTFFPSSIELMSARFPWDFGEFNILVKLHYFSHRKKRYRAHLSKIAKWRGADNIYVANPEEFSVVPFMDVAHIMISDASTTLFEFAALDKSVVWCDFWKLRWSYRGPFRYRLRRRMESSMERFWDIAVHAGCYHDLRPVVDAQFEQSERFKDKRKEYSEMLLGPLDGRAADRIADYLMAAPLAGSRQSS